MLKSRLKGELCHLTERQKTFPYHCMDICVGKKIQFIPNRHVRHMLESNQNVKGEK